MNRTIRRNRRLTAMKKTIVRMNKKVKDLRYSDPKREQLNAQREYIAQQIADASYTEYSMKYDHNEVKRIFSHMDEGGCAEWVKWDIKQLAASRRRWAIATSKQIWLG